MSHWKTLSSETLLQAGFFKVRADRCELPDGRVMPKYYVFEYPDWVNVVPVTSDGKVVLVRQHRHGAELDFLEIPGGSTHAGATEDPRLAAERELLEETGYAAAEWAHCGSHFPNPAVQGNLLHTYVAFGCKKVSEISLDPFEDLSVELMDLQDVIKLWTDGGFNHSLIAASLVFALKALREKGFKVSI
ncbi:MAG: NUDIX hydrolase [Bdellovibrionales bacterium]